MIRCCARSFAGVLALVLFATLATAQSLEVHVGGKHFNDAPALDTPLWPGRVTIGPDGRIYVVSRGDYALMRLDAASGTVSQLPTQGDRWPFKYIWDVAFGPDGAMYALRAGQVVKYDLEAGEFEVVAGALEGGGVPRSCYPNGWTGPSYPAQGSIAIHPNGSIYVLDTNSNWICAIGPWGITSRAVGVGGWGGFSGDGGPAEYASLQYPGAMTFDAAGNLYISDTENHRIRKVSTEDGIINTVAGNGQWNSSPDGIPVQFASIGYPGALAVDTAGNIFVYEGSSQKVRRIDAVTGVLSTVAGNGEWGSYGDGGGGGLATETALVEVTSIAVAANGDLYLSEMEGKRVRRVAFGTGVISTVLGNGTSSFCGENAFRTETCLDFPQGMAINAQGDLFIADAGNQRIRKVSGETGIVTTIAGRGGYEPASGDGGPAIDAIFGNSPAGLAFDAAGNLLIAGWWEQNVRRIDAATGIITTVAGTGVQGSTGDGGPATAAQLNVPSHVAVDAAGNLYVSEANGNRVRRIAAGTGVITTLAGTGSTSGPIGDGGPAAQASLSSPSALVFDAAGNLLIADTYHLRLRKVDLNTGIITTIAGNGTWGTSGNGGPATLASLGAITSLAVDAGGNIYVAANSSMRRIDATTGIIDSVPPGYVGLATPDGTSMESPAQMAFDPQGRLFVTDSATKVVWQIKGIPPAISDATPPDIQANISGTAGNLGWYRSDVQVSWTVADPESTVSSSEGCSASAVTSDTDGITFTCSATSAGGTASRTVTIKRDTAPPTLDFGAPSPAADASGYHSGDVSFAFNTADDLSGVYSTSTGNPVVITGEGLHLSAQVVVTDQAGNSASFTTPEVFIERSPPVITPNVVGTTFADGWYVTNPQVSFQVNDAQSPILSRDGCDATTVTEDTAGLTFTCTATSSGGTASASVTVKRDATAPVVTLGTPTPAPGPDGWYTGAVSIPWTVSDALSGFEYADLPNPIVISEEGIGITRKLSVRDTARNWIHIDTPPINIDFSPPAVQPLVVGTLGNNGWYTSDVQVSWQVVETPQNIISSTGCGANSVNADTAGVTFTCSVTSGGGTTSGSVTVKRDATPPTLQFGTASPLPNANGWYKVNVSIPFTRSDSLSGLASTSVNSPLVLSAEGAGVTGQVVVTDLAGNSATFTSIPRNIDKTAPVVAFASPAEGATYGFYQDVVAGYSCTDISLLSCTAPTPDGELINTRTAGARTFKVTAKDSVAFTTAVTHAFTVEPTFNFEGFIGGANEPPTLNLVSRGSLVPIRWRLPDGRGGFVTNPASFSSATVGSLTCGSAPVVALNDTPSGPAGISFDPGTSTFTYNWQTSTSWTGCRKLTIKLKDNSLHELRFKFQ